VAEVVHAECDHVRSIAGLEAADVVALQDFRATQRRQFQRSRAGMRSPRDSSRPPDRCNNYRLPRLAEHVIAVVARRAVDASATSHFGPAWRARRDARRPGSCCCSGNGTRRCGLPPCVRSRPHRMHHVREPDFVAVQSSSSTNAKRAFAEFLHAIAVLVQGFRKVRMQADSLVAAREPACRSMSSGLR